MSKNTSKKKDNFNQAMYEMFGIGKDNSSETDGVPDEFIAEEPVVDTPIVESVKEKPATEMPRRAQTTFFAEGTSIEGTLRCESDIEICGDFKGELIAKGKIVIHASTTSNVKAIDLALIGCNLTGDAEISNCVSIDEKSTIIGNVSAKDIICSGVVRGNLSISGNLTLNAKSKVFGDIKTNSLVIERGAKVSGKIEMSSSQS